MGGAKTVRQFIFSRTLLTNVLFTADMKKQFVYDPLISKRQQYLLATQVSINDVSLNPILIV